MPLSIDLGRNGERQYGLSTRGRIITRLRRKGPPSAVLVVFMFDILSEITSSRTLSALIPVAAMFIELNNPIISLYLRGGMRRDL
jgi:hypothetical protein